MNRKDELLAYLLKREGCERQSDYTIPLRDNDEVPPPLSFAQERFWFLDQFEHAHPVYNGCKVVRLIGQLSIEVLAECLNLIARRHEVLRTTYPAPDGRPIQRVAVACPIKISVTDLEHTSESDLPCAIERLARHEWLQPINLSEELPIRARLVRIDHARNLLILTLHQIAFDSRSVAIFFRELWTAYEAKLHGKEPELPALPVQYGDFAGWQRDRVSNETFQSQRDYWLQRLSGTLPVLNLPTDKPRPPVQRFDGSRLPILLPETLQLKLKELSRENGVTLFMTLLAAFKTLLYRYTAQEDLLVGCPVLNRRLPETENLLGSFVNTLVLRTNYAGSPSFREALRRVRATCVDAFAHQDFPFEKLVEELQPRRDLARNPIFQVMFAFQNTPVPALELAGLRSEAVEIDGGMTKFDLTLSLIDKEHGLAGHIEYSTDLFHHDTMERMAQHFQTLLEGIAVDPNQSIATLPIMTEPERHQVLFEWNDTAAEYPKDKCIHQLFEEQVERTPEAIAVELDRQQITYRELNRRANQLAHYLITFGIGPEKLVGICVERSIEMVVGLLAILKSGGAYVPLDPANPEERLRFMLEDAQVSVLLTQLDLIENRELRIDDRAAPEIANGGYSGIEKSYPRFSNLDPRPIVVSLDRDWPSIAQQQDENPKRAVTSNNLAYVVYTSGSTGKPKGVQIEHRSVVNCLLSLADRLGFKEHDVLLAVTTLSFDISVLELILPLFVGGKVVVASRDQAVDSMTLATLLANCWVTALQATPSTWRLLTEAGWEGSPGFKILCGGEAMSHNVAEVMLTRGEVWNLYGPTESTIWSTVQKVEHDEGPVLIGRPIANTRIYILDSHMQPVPIGVHGDLHIGGDGLARGYWNNPELTAERFISDPFSDDGDARLYRTGDRARYWADGTIEFLGRTDNQVKIRGHRIELGEIESVLTQHSAVNQAVVVPFDEFACDSENPKPVLSRAEGSKTGAEQSRSIENPKSLIAYVVSHDKPPPTISELRHFLQSKLPDYMIPSLFLFLDALPLTSNGKLDRNALPPPDGERPLLDNDFVEPRTEIEELVAQIWREVLNREKIGVYDNFFDLGGHSLLTSRVVARLHKQLSIEVPVRVVFEKPTIAGFAHAIHRALQNNQKIVLPIISPRPAAETFTPSIAQEPLLFLERTFPGMSLFNIPKAYQLDGPFDVEALEWSLNRVIERHEALRITFPMVDGRCVGYVSDPAPINLKVSDLRGLNEDSGKDELRNFVRDWASEPFDLSRGPLFRVSLLRLHEEVHVLLLVMHHIIADGASMLVFLRDLAAFYNARAKSAAPSLAPLNVQYTDYIAWQNQLARDNLLAPQLAYWRDQLKEPLPLLQLSSHPRSHTMFNFLSARKSVSVTGELFQSLKELSRTTGHSLFVILLTSIKALLYAYSNETDVRVATLVENRHRAETENIIGYLANTLIIRTKLSVDCSFQQLARQVRDVTLAAYAHQDLPFEAIVRALEQERNLDRACLAQVMFAYQPMAIHPLALGDVTLKTFGDIGQKEGPEIALTTFDLVLTLKETAIELVGSLIYNLEIFDEAAATEIVKGLYTILQRVVSSPAEARNFVRVSSGDVSVSSPC